MEKMICPVCGEFFDSDLVEYLDNGNPACLVCVNAERNRDELTQTGTEQ